MFPHHMVHFKLKMSGGASGGGAGGFPHHMVHFKRINRKNMDWVRVSGFHTTWFILNRITA